MKRLAIALATALFVVALPLFFAGTAVRFLFSWAPLYEYGFDRYGVANYTGIERPDLTRAAAALVAYFNNEEQTVNLTVTQRGVRRELFTEREVLHMVDVKALVRLFYRVQEVAALYLVGFVGVVVLRDRANAARRIGSGLMWGSAITFALLVALGALSFADFETLFLQFHQLSFQANDYWLLDPRIHNLIAMFPAPFWLDSTILLVLIVAAQAAMAFVVGWQVRRFLGARAAVAPVGSS